MSFVARPQLIRSSCAFLSFTLAVGCGSDSSSGAHGGLKGTGGAALGAGGLADGGIAEGGVNGGGGMTGGGGVNGGGVNGGGGQVGPGTGGSNVGGGGGSALDGGGGACKSSADCSGTADCIGGACVPYVACKNSLDCSAAEVCSPGHRCVECVSTADCAGGAECIGSKCVTVTPCTSDKQCTPLKQLCDTALGRCADCLSPADCVTGTTCVGGACVVSVCEPSKSFCDGSDIKACDATGQSATVTKTCAAGTFCDPKTVTCVAEVCTPSALVCDGTRATKCNALGTAYATGGTDCSTTKETCVAGVCKACGAGTTASAAVRMVEVMVGLPEYVVLQNTSGCDVNLNGLTMSFLTSTTSGVTATIALPSQTLAAGATVTVSDGTAGATLPVTDIQTTSNINWQATYGGAALLCTGPCTGTTVLDAFAFQGGAAPPALPSPVTFAPPLTSITTTNEQTDSFQRVAFKGASPTFAPSDWTTGAATRPGQAGTTSGPCATTPPTGACTSGASCTPAAGSGYTLCICSTTWLCL